MPPTVKVKSSDTAVRKHREDAAQRVIEHFAKRLPDRRLLCFFDDEDWHALKQEAGAANRGCYSPVRPGGLGWPPDYLSECLVVDSQFAFDDLVYLHGSTCECELGLTMTFAHELQHFVQHSILPTVWAANAVAAYTLRSLDSYDIEALRLRSCDIPHEREARIVAKRAAENLFGTDAVNQYIDAKIAERVNEQDVADWECIRGLVASTPYDLTRETKLFFPRLAAFRPRLERSFRYLRQSDPRFNDLNLDTLLGGTG